MRIGVSDKTITPEPGIELCGYLLRVQPSVGKYDELHARTLCVEEGGAKTLWIHCDLVGFTNGIASRIRRKVSVKFHVPMERVLLSATHTHAGPATVGLKKCGDIDPVYVDFLEERIVEGVVEAIGSVEDVSMLFSASTLDGIAFDRTRSEKNSHVDKTLPVVAFKRQDGTFKAVITNYAIHNVGMSHRNRHISADIAGYAAQRASSIVKGNPVVMVTNGGCGNINPVIMTDDYGAVEKLGAVLGDSIALEISRLAPCEDGEVSASFTELELPVEKLTSKELDEIVARHASGFEGSKPGYETERFREAIKLWSEDTRDIIEGRKPFEPTMAYLHILKIGPLVFVGINGEVFSKMAEQLRALTGIEKLYVVGYADGCIGYIATKENYEEGGYAVGEAHKFYANFRLKSGGFELIRDKVAAQLKGV